MFSDFLIVGKAPGLQLRKDSFSVDTHFEAATVRWNKHKPLDLVFQLSNKFFGQTDRLGFVVSDLTIDDFDLHEPIFLVCSRLGFSTMRSSIEPALPSGADSR